jgi:hypothetical protein
MVIITAINLVGALLGPQNNGRDTGNRSPSFKDDCAGLHNLSIDMRLDYFCSFQAPSWSSGMLRLALYSTVFDHLIFSS